MKNWKLLRGPGDIDKMSHIINKDKLICRILLNRDINTPRKVKNYLNANDGKFNDITLMKDLDKAINIIKEAIKNDERILLYGDYDVDGVTSTTIMYKTLKYLGANVNYYIPSRETEGYGLNIDTIDKIINTFDLIITLDNGIASIEENEYILGNNKKIIVIDHHEVPTDENGKEPDLNANAIVDSKQSVCQFPFKMLCTAGMAYRISEYLFYKLNKEFILKDELMVFAMIGTFCDIVDLKEDNRIIAKNGLDIINKNKKVNKGLYKLLEDKAISDKTIETFHIGFVIGPCINATGRLEKATLAVELFTSDDENKINELSNTLVELNEERKKMTDDSLNSALSIVENSNIKNNDIFVIYDESIHESIAGIVAGRIKDRYYHPTIVLTNGENSLKGSARSIESYNIFEEMSRCKDLFLRFGGHSMAAGLSIDKNNLEIFNKKINDNSKLINDDFIETLLIDDDVRIKDITYTMYQEINKLKPFGKDNRQPIFRTMGAKVVDVKSIKNKNTLIITFEDDNRTIKGITFGNNEYFAEILQERYTDFQIAKIEKGLLSNIDLTLDLVYYIDVNEFRNNISVQLRLKDFKLS